MIDITGLREDKRPQSSTIVHALLDLLEAAEKERDALRAAVRHEADCVEAAKAEIKALRSELVDLRSSMKFRTSLIGRTEAERDSLRAELSKQQALTDAAQHIAEVAQSRANQLQAKIAEMEKQEPVAWMLNCPTLGGDTGWILSWTQSGAGLCNRLQGEENEKRLYALPGAQPAPSVPNLDMDALERQNDWLREEVCRLREGLALIADQYEPKCSLLIPSIARTALNATGAYGQKESPASWPTEAMVTAFAELFNVRDQKNTFGPAFRAALAAAQEAKP